MILRQNLKSCIIIRMSDLQKRLVTPESQPDEPVDPALRPVRLNDFIGQEQLKENLSILIAAARQRKESLEHVLFYGPPGLGKTTLAHVLANEMGVNIKITAGPAVERAGDLAAILTNLRAGDILFIDEIHRLGRVVEEVLYPAMEDFALDIVIGKGPAARNIRLKMPRFTVIGATTRLALVSAPLRARFGAVYRLDYYDEAATEKILQRAAAKLSVAVEPEGFTEIARRARGTPRVALRLLRRVRDFAQVRAQGRVSRDVADEALNLLNVDPLGLDEVDRRVLSTIIEKYSGGPVGLNTIAASIGEEPDTIMDVVEPYLLQLGFVDRTPQGRVATRRAYEHLGFPFIELWAAAPVVPVKFQTTFIPFLAGRLMKTADFDYHLPEERIAQTPVEPRHASRLLVLDRQKAALEHTTFWHIADYLHPGDLLVINQTRVIPARVFARKDTGGRVELLLLRREDELHWEALVGGKGLHSGRSLSVEGGPQAEIVADLGGSRRRLRFSEPVEPFLPQVGQMPLPPYIHERLEDPERYQTVYARQPGSAAAPTAGLHFTPELIQHLKDQGVQFAEVTLHVGLDTFAPVTEADPQEHQIHTEWCELTPAAAEKINAAHRQGGRIVAVGTTSVRTLESAARGAGEDQVVAPFSGPTNLFILPGYTFRAVDALITNFHLPKSTLIMLVSAFAGRERILAAYQTAVELNYRFFSFGDAMLIL